MTIAIAVVSALLVACVCIGLFLWARGRSKAEAAQFRTLFLEILDGGYGYRRYDYQAALPQSLTVGHMADAFRLALNSLEPVFSAGSTISALGSGVRIIVHPVNSWTDPLTGREAGGTSRYGEIHVGADLSSLFHELAHRVIEVRHGVIDEEHVYFTEAVKSADERYRSELKGVFA